MNGSARGVRSGRRVAGLVLALTVVAFVLVSCGGNASERGSSRAATTTGKSPASTTATAGATATTAAPVTTVTMPPPTTTGAAPTAPPGPASVISRGNPSQMVVALTFDAGSDLGNAPAILDTLRANGIPAAFGLTGAWVRAHGDVVRRIVAEGHLAMNHTDDHRSFTGVSTNTAALTTAERRAELDGAEAAIVAATGRSTKPWFRPPYGDTDSSVQTDVAADGYGYEVMWTIDSLGWKGLTAQAITARCLDQAVPGAIYLFHVGSASQDAAALPAIIAGLRERGYTFATIPQLAGRA